MGRGTKEAIVGIVVGRAGVAVHLQRCAVQFGFQFGVGRERLGAYDTERHLICEATLGQREIEPVVARLGRGNGTTDF
jgi:hypothetical protein